MQTMIAVLAMVGYNTVVQTYFKDLIVQKVLKDNIEYFVYF